MGWGVKERHIADAIPTPDPTGDGANLALGGPGAGCHAGCQPVGHS